MLAGRQGLEPRFTGPEPVVLPLNDLPVARGRADYSGRPGGRQTAGDAPHPALSRRERERALLTPASSAARGGGRADGNIAAVDRASLLSRHCVPCRGGVEPLSEAAASSLLEATPEWSLAEGATRLVRRFEFEDFVRAMEFVNRVADLAEAEGHHPDISIHWSKVELVLWTHKIGGLHENDFVLAAKIDRLLEEPRRPVTGLAG